MVSRRTLLKGTLASGLVVAAPAILRAKDALASSGELNVFAWGDYIQRNQIDAFEKGSGIKLNLATYGSNDEAVQKLKAAGGKGFDVVFPSITNGPQYYAEELLQPLDESRLSNAGNVIPSIMDSSVELGGTYRGKRMLMPFNWGTEAITFDSKAFPLADDEVSFGSLWTPEAVGKSAFRQKSVLMGVGLYLDALGEVKSDRLLDVYKSEADARRVFDACSAFIVDHRDRIAAFWNNATEASGAFTQAGAAIGQTWDTTGLLLAREDAKWKYRMPKEGGLAWLDSVGIPAGATNLEQSYAFIDALMTPEMGGMMSANTGYNSAVSGASGFAGDDYKRQFAEVYDAESLANLWWWQPDTPWFSPTVQSYVDRITNA